MPADKYEVQIKLLNHWVKNSYRNILFAAIVSIYLKFAFDNMGIKVTYNFIFVSIWSVLETFHYILYRIHKDSKFFSSLYDTKENS